MWIYKNWGIASWCLFLFASSLALEKHFSLALAFYPLYIWLAAGLFTVVTTVKFWGIAEDNVVEEFSELLIPREFWLKAINAMLLVGWFLNLIRWFIAHPSPTGPGPGIVGVIGSIVTITGIAGLSFGLSHARRFFR